MKNLASGIWAAGCLILLLVGCATYDTSIERGHSLAGMQRYFVVTNLNDNHALDQQIVASLTARGVEAAAGPLTMMPALKLSVRETRSEQPFAGVTFSATVPLKKPVDQIVDQLVERLLATKP